MIVPPLRILSDRTYMKEIAISTKIANNTVSVIVPYYQAKKKLDLTLESILKQDYPKDLTEVIVVDDGSDPPLLKEDLPDGVILFTQHKDGFGAARARNNGALIATGDILVFVDCDMVLSRNNISTHAMWHQNACNLYTTLCNIRFVDEYNGNVDGIENAPYHQAKHLMNLLYREKRNSLIDHQYILSNPPGPNFAIRRNSYWYTKGQSELFKHWGLEDTHFLYRAYAHGLSIVLITDAYGIHVGKPTNRLFHISGAVAEQLIPVPQFRKSNQKRTFIVPEYAVGIKSSDAEVILSLAFDVLDNAPYDLILLVDVSNINNADFVKMRLQYDIRVRFGLIEEIIDIFPDSAFYIIIDTESILKQGIVNQLRRHLKDFASVIAYDNANYIEITRSGLSHHYKRYPHHCVNSNLVEFMPVGKFIKKNGYYDITPPIDEPRDGKIKQIIKRALYIYEVEGIGRSLMWIGLKIKSKMLGRK